MSKFLHDINKVAKEAPRLYFAPLIGAVNAVKRELRRTELTETRERRKEERRSTPANL